MTSRVLVVVGERPGDEVCARGVWEGRARVSEESVGRAAAYAA